MGPMNPGDLLTASRKLEESLAKQGQAVTIKIDFKEYVAWERRRDLQKWFEQERKRQEPLPGKSGSKMGSGLGPGSIP